MRKTLSIIAVIVSMVVLIAAVAYIFILTSRLNLTLSNLSSAKASLSDVSDQLEQTKVLLKDKEANLTDAESELKLTKTNLTNSETKITEIAEKNDELEQSIKDIQKKLSDSSQEVSKLKKRTDFYECKDSIDMDYSSVLAASSRLMSYVDGLDGVDHVSGAFRNTLWNNADSKIYGVRYVADDKEMYTMQFLIFFDEFGMKKGVFYVDGQCWLDSPMK